MDDSELKTLMGTVAEICARAIVEKNYSESILVGTLGYTLFHRAEHTTFAHAALGFVSDAIAFVTDSPDQQLSRALIEEPSCSFCGRRRPEVKLAAGAKAFICDSCVALLAGVFAADKGNGDRV